MSLLSELHAFLGPSSVPVVSAGCVYGIFAAGEKMTSHRARDALSQWLLSFEIRKVAALPEIAQELFDRVFGERHLSIKCFVRSVLFSIGTTAVVTLLAFLISPQRVVDNVTIYLEDFKAGISYMAYPLRLASMEHLNRLRQSAEDASCPSGTWASDEPQLVASSDCLAGRLPSVLRTFCSRHGDKLGRPFRVF
jgi:hypothetical protein